MSKTVAANLVEILEHAGVKHIHGVVGDSLNGITDELRKSTKIKWIHYRHEEAAAFAAGAASEPGPQISLPMKTKPSASLSNWMMCGFRYQDLD